MERAYVPVEGDETAALVTVEFTAPFESWPIHTRADFSPAWAAALVRAGVAEYADGPPMSTLAHRYHLRAPREEG